MDEVDSHPETRTIEYLKKCNGNAKAATFSREVLVLRGHRRITSRLDALSTGRDGTGVNRANGESLGHLCLLCVRKDQVMYPMFAQDSGMTRDLLIDGCLYVEESVFLQVKPIHKAQLPSFQE
jgi:hypothetical protein